MDGIRFCHTHRGLDLKCVGATMVFGMIGGGLGGPLGALGGVAVGYALDQIALDQPERKRVFISFDFSHDRGLKAFLVGQSRRAGARFTITDGSLCEAAPEAAWEEHAKHAIRECDMMIVMVGCHTHRASGVLKEVAIARRLGKPVVQVVTRQGDQEGFRRVQRAGRRYVWTQANLESIFR